MYTPSTLFNIKSIRISFHYILIMSLLTSCHASVADTYPTPKKYDLNHPFKIELSEQLNEISGIQFYAKDSSVFAISDATGSLYKIFLGRKNIVQKWKFGKNADYEDLQLVDSTFYILSSTGDLASVKFFSKDSLQVNFFQFPGKDKNEFETLFYDKESGMLNMICKNCEADKKKSVTVWSFNPKENKYQPGTFSIDVAPIANKMGLDKLKFKCSAAAINPITNELFILSSVNKALIIADKAGNTKEIYPLDPSIYKQPEGIAFTPAGDLLISNESHKTGFANILVFKFQKGL